MKFWQMLFKNPFFKKVKFVFLALFFSSLINITNAQVCGYSFQQQMGTYTEITGGTILFGDASGSSYWDDEVNENHPIGFTFALGGNTFTRFSLNPNGFIALGNVVARNLTDILCGGRGDGSNNIISALTADIYSVNSCMPDFHGNIQYLTSGIAPNRVLTIQWKNVGLYGSNEHCINFQIKLYETSNQIRFIYGPFTTSAFAYNEFQVGLAGSSDCDFLIRQVNDGESWINSKAGITPCANIALTSSSKPPTGLTYIYNYGVANCSNCCPPSNTNSSNVTSNSATIDWTASNSNPSGGYDYEIRTSGVGGSGSNGLISTGSVGAGVTTTTISGLSANTSYTVYVRSNCGNGSYSQFPGGASFTTLNCLSAGNLTGNENICVGSSTSWSTTGTGGSWSSSNTAIATINANGLINGLAPGTAVIRYRIPASPGCPASTVEKNIRIHAIPNAPTASDITRVGPGMVILSATAANDQTIDWYTTAIDGNRLATGTSSFTTPSINQSTTYFALARNTLASCVSPTRTAVRAIIWTLSCPTIVRRSDDATSNSCAGSSTTISTNVINTPFEAIPNSTKTGEIQFNFTTNPWVVPVITKIWLNGGLSSIQAGPPSMVTQVGSSYQLSYCFYGNRLPNAGIYTIEFSDPQTNQVLRRCSFTADTHQPAIEPPLSNTPAPILSNFQNITKVDGDAPFTLTAPNSNSPGAFNYTSSNTSVGTITNNVMSISSPGTTVITATQMPTTNFSVGKIAALVTVLPKPTIAITSSLSTFTACEGSNSTEQSFSLSGQNMLGDVNVTAPTGFEISLQPTTAYGPSVTIPAIGTLNNTTLYIRLAKEARNNPTGIIEINSVSANSKSVQVSGMVTPAPVISTILGNQGVCLGSTTNFTANSENGIGVWSSSHTLIASIHQTSGLINAIAPGKALITYTLTGREACATSVVRATREIQINPLPSLLYHASAFEFIRTQQITILQPTSTFTQQYSIDRNLPDGLQFNRSTGVISGTPLVAQNNTTFTITATSSEGCTSFTRVNITIVPVAPRELRYTPSSQQVRRGFPILSMQPNYIGDPVNFSIAPELPRGLQIDPITGIIQGTVSIKLNGQQTYTITASNTGGTTTSNISLTFNTAPTDISLQNASVDENAPIGTTVGSLSAIDEDQNDVHRFEFVSGIGSDDNELFSIVNNTLTTAKIFDYETKNKYSIRLIVMDEGGLSYEKTFTLSINDLDNEDTDGDGYLDSEEKGANPNLPRDSDGDNIPDFKDLDSDNDEVPDAVERIDKTSQINPLDYKDTDKDLVPDHVEMQDGTDPNDPKINYKDTDGDLVPDYVEKQDGTQSNNTTQFKDSDRGGTPDYVERFLYVLFGIPSTDPSIYADDKRDYDGDGLIDYEELKQGKNPNDAPSNLIYTPSSIVAEKGTTTIIATPSYTQGKPLQFTITPNLPAGVSFNTSTGVISGTAIELQPNPVIYTIVASNFGGKTTASFTLQVNDVPPANLSITPSTQLSEQGKTITNMTANSTGGPVVLYSINPSLPDGLSINEKTGIISGIRTKAITGTVNYTITASNSGGSTTSLITMIYNTKPTNILLSKANIYENNKPGDLIGNLSTEDIDNPEVHRYTLVSSGLNAYDNRYFKIQENRLLADTTFQYTFRNSYTILVRSTDSQGLSTEKLMTISISKRPEIYGISSNAFSQLSGSGITQKSTRPIVSKGYSSQLEIEGTDIQRVLWKPAIGLSSNTSLRPIFKNNSTTTYTVTITNVFGSEIELPFTVEVRDDYYVKPSNILSTRQDGINDYFIVENIETYPDNEITIFDRTGRVLTKLYNYNNRWDGRLNGKYLSDDTYYYIIRFRSNPNSIIKGFITIINN